MSCVLDSFLKSDQGKNKFSWGFIGYVRDCLGGYKGQDLLLGFLLPKICFVGLSVFSDMVWDNVWASHKDLGYVGKSRTDIGGKGHKKKTDRASLAKKFPCIGGLSALQSHFLWNQEGKAKKQPRKIRGLEPRSSAYVVVATGPFRVMEAKNPHKRIYPASLTKMMTLYLLFEALERRKINMSTQFRVSFQASRQSPSKLFLKPGSYVSVKKCILGLAVKSANDVAMVAAEGLGGGHFSNFVTRMNHKAQELGMSHTHFANASGLFHPFQYSTAKDMACLMHALIMDFPRYSVFLRQKDFCYRGAKVPSTNKMLGSTKGVIGGKTGYIYASGYNMALAVHQNNKTGIFVVIGSHSAQDRFKTMKKLLASYFKGSVGGLPSVLGWSAKNELRRFRKNRRLKGSCLKTLPDYVDSVQKAS
jgi:D-alanyl-D-alanine carboxypeptidase